MAASVLPPEPLCPLETKPTEPQRLTVIYNSKFQTAIGILAAKPI